MCENILWQNETKIESLSQISKQHSNIETTKKIPCEER